MLRFLKQSRSRGMTLLEVMISLVIFTMLAAGILAMGLSSRSSMNETLMRNIAFDAANSLLDQIKSQKFGTVLDAYNKSQPSGAPVAASCLQLLCNDYAHNGTATVGLFVNYSVYRAFVDNTGNIGSPSGIKLGDERIPFNHTSKTGSVVYLPNFKARVKIAPVNDANTGTSNALLITVDYQYDTTTGGATRSTVTNSISYLQPKL